MRSLICAAVFAFVATPTWAQNKLDAQALKLYGGTYSSDCSSPAAPRLRVVADALMVEQGKKRLTGRDAQPAYSYFGQSPPPDYQVVLLSEVRAGLQLLFIVYRDKLGQYITLDGDSKVQSALGRDLLGRKYRSCNAAGKETPSALPVTPQPEAMMGPPELLLDAKFRSAYYKALGPRSGRAGWPNSMVCSADQENQCRWYGIHVRQRLQESRLAATTTRCCSIRPRKEWCR
jgi:hypothetical protein